MNHQKPKSNADTFREIIECVRHMKSKDEQPKTVRLSRRLIADPYAMGEFVFECEKLGVKLIPE